MALQFRNGRFLALLLVILSYFTLCHTAPTTDITVISWSFEKRGSEVHQFEKRYDYAAFLGEFEQATTVGQGEEKFLPWGSGTTMLASDGFMGCIGIMIVGDGGAIIGHYSNSETDIRQAEANLPGLISDNSAALSGAKAYLYAQVKLRQPDDWVSEPNNLRLIKIVEDNLHITPERVKYIEPEDMMVDDNDELLDECPDDLLYGAMLVKHTDQSTSTTFMDLAWQVAAAGWA